MPFILPGKLNGRAVNISRKFPPRSPLRSPRLGVSIWKNQRQKKLGEVKAERRKQKAEMGQENEEVADSSAIQNMERDAPWTAWSKMLQQHEEAACSSIHNPQSTIHDPRSTICNPT
ncbi:MAG: hypothetical protein ACK49N_05270 [Verrucomicrobiota bacterium]